MYSSGEAGRGCMRSVLHIVTEELLGHASKEAREGGLLGERILLVGGEMADYHLLTVAFGILGNVVSFVVFLAPLPTFYRIYRKKSTEGFQSLPYLVALFSGMLWLYYAFLKGNSTLLITINSFGSVIETVYIAMYIAYAPKAVRARVIRTKSVEFMPFYLSFFLTVSAIMWFGYGFFGKDWYIMTPNILGFFLGLCQMALYGYFRNKDGIVVVEEKLPQHIANTESPTSTPVTVDIPAPIDGGEACADEQQPSQLPEGTAEVVVSGDDLRAREDLGV
ncbi:hypothetical protein NL676_019940 [Syzygium grande]|nr:hypothetical protein NL676_019940 [Syzygium grande]